MKNDNDAATARIEQLLSEHFGHATKKMMRQVFQIHVGDRFTSCHNPAHGSLNPVRSRHDEAPTGRRECSFLSIPNETSIGARLARTLEPLETLADDAPSTIGKERQPVIRRSGGEHQDADRVR